MKRISQLFAIAIAMLLMVSVGEVYGWGWGGSCGSGGGYGYRAHSGGYYGGYGGYGGGYYGGYGGGYRGGYGGGYGGGYYGSGFYGGRGYHRGFGGSYGGYSRRIVRRIVTRRVVCQPAITPSVVTSVTKANLPRARATLGVNVPENAAIYINGVLTESTGKHRVFASAPIKDGKAARFQVRAVLKEGGQTAEATKVVTVKAGSKRQLAFDLRRPTAVQTAQRSSAKTN